MSRSPSSASGYSWIAPSGTSSTDRGSAPSTDSSSATAPTTGADPATATNPDGAPIAQSMPYVGMDAALIDATWMGVHDAVDPVVGGTGLKVGAVPYRWNSQNGKNDRIFTAYVRDGKVIAVSRDMPWSNYWAQADEFGLRDFPDRTASGERVEKKKLPAKLPDPLDYDDADSFAEDAEAYYKEHGSADPYDDAVRYWEENAG